MSANIEHINAKYVHLINGVLETGERQVDRTGVGTISVFAPASNFTWDSGDGIAPVITLKHLNVTAVAKELAWFIHGHTNIQTLGCGIWDAWARPDGECGPIYGAQWRGTHGGPDQVRWALKLIEANPTTRQAVVNSWNPTDISSMVLPPCHTLYQFKVVRGRLDLQLYQRSADLGLGVPFNILSYYWLQHLCAAYLGRPPGVLTIVYGDLHIYNNHEEALSKLVDTWAGNPWTQYPRDWDNGAPFALTDTAIELFRRAIDRPDTCVTDKVREVSDLATALVAGLGEFTQGPRVKLDVAV